MTKSSPIVETLEYTLRSYSGFGIRDLFNERLFVRRNVALQHAHSILSLGRVTRFSTPIVKRSSVRRFSPERWTFSCARENEPARERARYNTLAYVYMYVRTRVRTYTPIQRNKYLKSLWPTAVLRNTRNSSQACARGLLKSVAYKC